MSKKIISAVLILVFSVIFVFAQDKQELEAERSAKQNLKGEHPLAGLMKSKISALKPELAGKHPRVFVTDDEIEQLKRKTKTQKELWKTALSRVRALQKEPAPFPALERRGQNEVGLGIAAAAFVYKITGELKYLDAARKYMDAACGWRFLRQKRRHKRDLSFE